MKWSILTALAVTILGGSLVAAEPEVVFEDAFKGKPGEGWTWLRENPKAWRIAEDALELRIEPGDAQTVKNALLRDVPDRSKGPLAIEVTVTSLSPPKVQYEQAGLPWSHDGKRGLKFVKELADGKLLTTPGRLPMDAKTVQLRLVVDGARLTAQFRPDGKGEFKTAAEAKLPEGGKDQISIQCYHGPTDVEHWIRFDDFRIVRLGK
jgi:hypothetical protein